jgi:fructokinase
MSGSEYVIGIDLGGTKVEACLLDGARQCISRQRRMSEVSLGLDHVLENIVTLVHGVAQGKSFRAVGIGTPGTYDSEEDRLYGSPHTPLYETPGFMGRLKEKLGVLLVVENDANCLALAEYFHACLGRFRSVMAVILGTGIGCGLILDKKLYRGVRGGAGEIGHTTLDVHGQPCQCGRIGCAEAYLSGPSLIRRFAEASGETLPVQDIYRRYEKGDSRAVALFEESCLLLAELLANAVNTLDLEAVILGGGVSNLPIWYERVEPLVQKSLFGPPRPPIALLKAGLGDSAGVFGAAFLALREIGRMEF